MRPDIAPIVALEKDKDMFHRIAATLAVLIAIGSAPAARCAEPIADIPEVLTRCAITNALGLAANQPDDGPERIADTALQICYQENMEAQNAFRAEQTRQQPAIGADELVALWDVRRSELRTALIAAITACRGGTANRQCDP